MYVLSKIDVLVNPHFFEDSADKSCFEKIYVKRAGLFFAVLLLRNYDERRKKCSNFDLILFQYGYQSLSPPPRNTIYCCWMITNDVQCI